MAGHCVAALPPWNRVPALPATRAALPRKNTTGSNAIKKRESTDANASFVSAGTQRCPACSHSDYCTSFRYRPLDCGRSYRYIGTVITIRTHRVLPTLRELEDTPRTVRTPCVLPTLREIGDFPLAVRMRRILTTLPDDVRQAARIRRILALSRESVALSNDSESRAARRRRCLGPCEAVEPPRIRGAERRAWPASSHRECRRLPDSSIRI